jgi:hypothetical protein
VPRRLHAGRRRAPLCRALIKHFPRDAAARHDQAAIDAAARSDPAERRAGLPQPRYVYTPVSAILHHALGDNCPVIRRPKGSKGRRRPTSCGRRMPSPSSQAERIDAEFGLYLRLLIYTGIRKGEGCHPAFADIQPGERAAWLRDSKNDDPRMLQLREDLVAASKGPSGRATAASGCSASTMAAISNICCCAPSSPPAACRARCGGRPAGSRRNTGWPSSASTPSATPGRHGCAATAAPTCRAWSKPRTGATRAARALQPRRRARGMGPCRKAAGRGEYPGKAAS